MNKKRKNEEMRIYGKNACLVAFKSRPQDLIKVYLTEKNLFEFKHILKFCSDKKLAYHIVSSEEMESISKATHHEDVCMIFKQKIIPELEKIFSSTKLGLILALEEVENPHNLGAIMRTAAHFGVKTIIYKAKVPVAQTASAYRTAEGGAEALDAIQIESWDEVFRLSKKYKFELCATSGAEGESLFEFQFPDRIILFLGAEGRGISSQLLKKLDKKLTIPGTGLVESLNVSNANTSILTEWFRQKINPHK